MPFELAKDEIAAYKNADTETLIERHLNSVKAEMAAYAALAHKLDEAYVPSSRLIDGSWDFHPQNRVLGQAHVNIPVVYTTVNLKSNVLGMRPPKFNIRPANRKDAKARADAELVESIIDKLWEDEGMDEVHMNLCRNLSLYGRAVLQDGPDFSLNIDQQANVWISWRRLGEPQAISFVEMVSPKEAIDLGWDGESFDDKLRVDFQIYGSLPHDDPIGARSRNWESGMQNVLISGGVPVLHYYDQKRKNGNIYYSLVVNGIVIKKAKNLGRKTWPFVIVEAEHVPGLSTGVGDAEPILDIQNEINERNSAWAEVTRRTIKDQWKAWGIQHLTPRTLPGGAQVWEMTSKEDEDIEPIKFVPNDPGTHLYIQNMWANYRRVTGIPDEAEGIQQGATSGYAMNVKFQALVTNLAPRRIRLQRAYKKWAINKLETVKGQFPDFAYLIDEAEYTMEVTWEEITPRDMQATSARLAQLVANKLMSPYTAMEELSLVPEDEMAILEEWLTNPKLNPQGAMAEAQAMLMLAQVQAQSAANPGAGFSLDQLVQKDKLDALKGIEKGGPERNQVDLPTGRELPGSTFGSPVVQSAA